jgi:hypothetical protein
MLRSASCSLLIDGRAFEDDREVISVYFYCVRPDQGRKRSEYTKGLTFDGLGCLQTPGYLAPASSADLMTALEAYSQPCLLCFDRRLGMNSRTTPRRICTVLAALDTRGWGCMIMLYVIRRV